MREGAKKRLIGAVVIVALAVIFVPMLFEPESLDGLPPVHQAIPPAPAFAPPVKGEVFLGPQDSGVGGLGAAAPTVSQPLPLPPVGDSAPVPIAPPARATTGGEPGAGPLPKPAASAPVHAAPLAVPEAPPDKSAKPPAKAAASVEPAPARAGSGWVIQVLSGGSREAAEAQRDKLRAAGFAAFIEEAQVNGKAAYRVQVGPEPDRARAEQTAARLREKQKVNTFIKNNP